jgi:nucleoside phosphorylase
VEPPPIALVVALSQERRALRHLLSSPGRARVEDFPLLTGTLAGRPVLLVQAGPGPERARRALLAAASRFSVGAAWSLGFAGGLVDTLRPGDLVCPGLVLKDDGRAGQAFHVAPARAAVLAALSAAGIPLADGSLLSVDAPLRTPEAKRAAHRRTGAVAVDMEAAGVAEAAGRLGIPWLAIKGVVDAAGEPLPPFLAGCTTPRGDLRWRGVLACLAVGSRRQALGRLTRASRRAARALAGGLTAAVPAWLP